MHHEFVEKFLLSMSTRAETCQKHASESRYGLHSVDQVVLDKCFAGIWMLYKRGNNVEGPPETAKFRSRARLED